MFQGTEVVELLVEEELVANTGSLRRNDFIGITSLSIILHQVLFKLNKMKTQKSNDHFFLPVFLSVQ